jgi:hypothetical protein
MLSKLFAIIAAVELLGQLEYPRPWNFFAAYFPDADLDNLTDEVVVAEYKAEIQEHDLQ